jgi:hypothetical protein
VGRFTLKLQCSDIYSTKLSTSLAFWAQHPHARETIVMVLNFAVSLRRSRLARRCDAASPATPHMLNLRDSHFQLGYFEMVYCCDPK